MIDKSEMIFGVRAVIEAVQAGKDIDKILVKKDIQSDLSKELFAALKGTLIPVQRVPVERINRITRKNHQGVIAFVSAVTYQKTEDLVPFLFEEGKNPLILDSKEPTASYRDFLMGEVRYSSLTRTFPDRAEKLFESAEKSAHERYEMYKRLAEPYAAK